MTSRPGNKRKKNRKDSGRILLDCLLAMLLLAVGYLGVVRALSGAIIGTEKQNVRIAEQFNAEMEQNYVFFTTETEE